MGNLTNDPAVPSAESSPVWDPRSETLSDARKRLWADGRYREFRQRFEELALGENIRSSKGRDAFYTALASFPPLDLPADTVVADVEPESVDPGETSAELFEDAIDLLAELGDADSGDIEREIRWAYSKLAAYQDADRRKHKAAMRGIELSAPNTGAVQMLRSAASNPNKFTLETVPKFLSTKAGDQQSVEEMSRRSNASLLERLDEMIRCIHCGELPDLDLCGHCGNSLTKAARSQA